MGDFLNDSGPKPLHAIFPIGLRDEPAMQEKRRDATCLPDGPDPVRPFVLVDGKHDGGALLPNGKFTKLAD